MPRIAIQVLTAVVTSPSERSAHWQTNRIFEKISTSESATFQSKDHTWRATVPKNAVENRRQISPVELRSGCGIVPVNVHDGLKFIIPKRIFSVSNRNKNSPTNGLGGKKSISFPTGDHRLNNDHSVIMIPALSVEKALAKGRMRWASFERHDRINVSHPSTRSHSYSDPP
jgi:hypothetical protein